MGIFDLFKKKQSTNTEINKTSQSEKDNIVISNVTLPKMRIHDDLKGLLWFENGPFKNYEQNVNSKNVFNVGGINFSISFSSDIEPSLIDTTEHIVIPNDISVVPRPPYYPTYHGLSPEQKGVYMKLLENPYNTNIDIGFVFILYYGLERHLLCGNYEKAVNTILKLRDVHTNKSFQSYSANALVLTSLLKNRGEIALDFIHSLDKEYEFSFSDNLFLLCYYSFDIPLTAKDIMRMAKTFEFDNQNYIKKYPEIFESILQLEIENKFGSKEILISKLLNKSDISKLNLQDEIIFANLSIRDKSVKVPMLSQSFKLKRDMNILLENTHELAKKKIADMRKSGNIPENKEVAKEKKLPIFDKSVETALLSQLDDAGSDLVKRHFVFLQLEDFYYKYRDLDNKYLEKCMSYCYEDINSLKEMEQQYVDQEINDYKSFADLDGDSEKKQQAEINKITKTGFIGRIPSFSRLVIIYEKNKEYKKAIEICDKAISFKHEKDEYKKRKEKLLEKLQKQK